MKLKAQSSKLKGSSKSQAPDAGADGAGIGALVLGLLLNFEL
jgi:hypothetical protein